MPMTARCRPPRLAKVSSCSTSSSRCFCSLSCCAERASTRCPTRARRVPAGGLQKYQVLAVPRMQVSSDSSCGRETHGRVTAGFDRSAWITAIIVLTIWFIGSSIHADPATTESTLRLHTSIAISAYALLWVRIVWRFGSGHPGPLPEQNGIFHTIGRWCHYAMLGAIGAMLLSGPLMAWARGDVIQCGTGS